MTHKLKTSKNFATVTYTWLRKGVKIASTIGTAGNFWMGRASKRRRREPSRSGDPGGYAPGKF